MLVQCPRCSTKIEAPAGFEMSCPVCTTRIRTPLAVSNEPPARTSKKRGKSDSSTAATILAGVFGLLLFACCSGVFFRSDPRERGLRTGDEVLVYVDGLEEVGVATSEAAHEEFGKFASARDGIGITQLVLSGHLLLVESRARAKLIERGFLKHRIRILSGRHIGRDGWITAEWVQPAR